ncbi:hypothetical protein HDU82_008488 [Entophlyctis luteolus]|nr:hypothetical protein HDU82_008488 [Entophlyctis luteolus]
MDSDNLIPLDTNNIEITGLSPNWWLGLSIMHNLFARNHNNICSQLAQAYPNMTDEQLFQTARLVNAAISAKIHTVEWTPALLTNKHLYLGMNVNWNGLPSLNYDGLLGHENTEPLNVTYQFPEEFVAIYRMHPLLPDTIPFQPIGANAPVSSFQLGDLVFRGSGSTRKMHNISDLIHSFGTNLMGALTLNNHPTALTNLTLLDGSIMDVSMVDILRDRERGIPKYNAYRDILKLPKMQDFSDITNDPFLAKKLSDAYGGNIDDVDLLVGSLAEDNRPAGNVLPTVNLRITISPGFAFSETTFRLFTVVASRRISADRLLTTDYTSAVYTAKGLEIVQKATMASILATNFPELAESLANATNPFLLWQDHVIQNGYNILTEDVQNEVNQLALQFN